MKHTSLLALAASLVLVACSSGPAVAPADLAVREPLLASVAALEGRWVGEPSEGMTPVHEFAVTSAGTVVRETMFPGTEHEMTNMYALDGDGLTLTHYCAMGNQPRMRARAIRDGQLVFEPEQVFDLNAKDEVYMGGMTLVILDENHIEERWQAFVGDELDHEVTFALTRVR